MDEEKSTRRHKSKLEKLMGVMDKDIRRKYHIAGLFWWTMIIGAICFAIANGGIHIKDFIPSFGG